MFSIGMMQARLPDASFPVRELGNLATWRSPDVKKQRRLLNSWQSFLDTDSFASCPGVRPRVPCL